MSDPTDKSAAEKLFIIEQELARVRAEYATLKRALRDPALTSWIDGHGQMPQRSLTTMEVATAKHMTVLRPQIDKLEAAEALLIVRTLDETAGKPSDGGLEDPEALLRAALVCLAHAWKRGYRDIEHRVTLTAIARYLESLDADT